MILDLIKASWKPLIFIALVSFITTWIFGIQNTLITKYMTDTNIYVYRFNAYSYMQNISNAFTTNALNFDSILPTRTWDETGFDFWSQADFWEAIINNLAFLLDWLYFPINFILYVIRWLAWLFRALLALIGWNTQYYIQNNNIYYYSELVRIIDWITANLVIPYV